MNPEIANTTQGPPQWNSVSSAYAPGGFNPLGDGLGSFLPGRQEALPTDYNLIPERGVAYGNRGTAAVDYITNSVAPPFRPGQSAE